MKQNIIYGLIDPITKELRYIGKTNNIQRRIIAHCAKSSLQKKNHKNSWIKSLIDIGLRPEIFILETYESYSELYDAEIELIEYFKYIGCNLTNLTSGGDGQSKGFKHSEETKIKISNSEKGRVFSEETKKKISKSLTGKTLSQDVREKISKSLFGRTQSKDTINKRSKSLKGKNLGKSTSRKGKKLLMVDGKRTYV